MMKIALALLACLLLLSGCTPKAEPQKPKPPTVEIRISNRGTVPIEKLAINFRGQTEKYAALAPGEATEYRTITRAYPFAVIEGTAAGKTVLFQVEDYVGVNPLVPGQYTYALKVKPDGTTFDLECVKD